MADAITAHGLVKRYKDVTALDGVDLTVPEGTVLGLLGPNGAGKTTIVRILTTLLQPDAGTAEVAGIDVLAHPREVRRRIGLSGQYAAVDEYLTGFENLDMIGRLYHLGRKRVPRAGTRAARARSGSRTPATGPQDLLRRHAAPARPRGRAGRGPAGAVPRRADHRARPPRPHRHVGGHPGPRRGRHDAAAHHAVPRGGRPARRRDRGHRPRPDHRAGHRRPAEDAGRWRAARAHRQGRGSARRGPGPARAHWRRQGRPRRAVAGSWSCRSPAARRCSPRRCAFSTPPASRSTTSGCAARRSTTCSCRSPVTRAEEDEDDPDQPTPDDAAKEPHDEHAPDVFADAAVVAKRNLIKIKRVPDLLVFTTLSADHVRPAVRVRVRRGDRVPAAASLPRVPDGRDLRADRRSSAPPSPAPAWPTT